MTCLFPLLLKNAVLSLANGEFNGPINKLYSALDGGAVSKYQTYFATWNKN